MADAMKRTDWRVSRVDYLARAPTRLRSPQKDVPGSQSLRDGSVKIAVDEKSRVAVWLVRKRSEVLLQQDTPARMAREPHPASRDVSG